MGLATIDSHSLKELTEIHKIPKFGVNQTSFHWDTAIWKCQNLQRNVWQSGRCPTRRPDAIHFFVNFDVFKSLYLSQNQAISKILHEDSFWNRGTKWFGNDLFWLRINNVIPIFWLNGAGDDFTKMCYKAFAPVAWLTWEAAPLDLTDSSCLTMTDQMRFTIQHLVFIVNNDRFHTKV